MTNRLNRGLGWIPDIPSIKDYTEDHPEVSRLLAATRVRTPRNGKANTARHGTRGGAAAATALDPRVDLSAHFSPIEDQGELGSCTANAAVALIEYFEKRAMNRHIDASRLFVYKVTRNLLGWTGDTGAYLRTTMGALTLFGAPPEQYWPYDSRPEETNTRFDAEPTPFCYAFAANFQSVKYLRLDPRNSTGEQVLVNVKNYLRAGFPSMFGLPVYDEFYEPAAGAKIGMPSSGSRFYGGHAIVAAGFDDKLKIGGDTGALLIRNSWGTGWGEDGYAWLSYKYVTEKLADDWWTVVSQEWVNTAPFKA